MKSNMNAIFGSVLYCVLLKVEKSKVKKAFRFLSLATNYKPNISVLHKIITRRASNKPIIVNLPRSVQNNLFFSLEPTMSQFGFRKIWKCKNLHRGRSKTTFTNKVDR